MNRTGKVDAIIALADNWRVLGMNNADDNANRKASGRYNGLLARTDLQPSQRYQVRCSRAWLALEATSRAMQQAGKSPLEIR